MKWKREREEKNGKVGKKSAARGCEREKTDLGLSDRRPLVITNTNTKRPPLVITNTNTNTKRPRLISTNAYKVRHRQPLEITNTNTNTNRLPPVIRKIRIQIQRDQH